MFLIHAFQRVVAPCFRELGPYKSRKNNSIATYTKGTCIVYVGESLHISLTGASMSEPHTSLFNCDFPYIYIYIYILSGIRRSVYS